MNSNVQCPARKTVSTYRGTRAFRYAGSMAEADRLAVEAREAQARAEARDAAYRLAEATCEADMTCPTCGEAGCYSDH